MIMKNLLAFAKIGQLRSSARMPAPYETGRQRGVTLLEGIFYLVFVLGLFAGGIAMFLNIQLSNRVTEAARGVVMISSETRALHQNARDFGSADLTPALVNGGAVPSNFLNNAGDDIRHPWGGAVTVTGNDQLFTITLEDVPSAACVRLSPVDARGQGLAGIGVASVEFDAPTNGDADYAGTGTAGVVDAPVSPIDAGAGCGNQTFANITFTYER
jgi:hypothetical protein